jgi:hypothetical protein
MNIDKPAPRHEKIETVGLIACCKEKQPFTCRAEDLYISPLFTKAKAYILPRVDTWAILSARHGLLFPNAKCDPYNTCLDELNALERKRWYRKVNKQLRAYFPGSRFIVIAGALYRGCLEGLDVRVPLQNLGIGQQLRKLDEWIAADKLARADTLQLSDEETAQLIQEGK